MSQLLSALGFTSDELHACEAFSDGRIVVPAAIDGESLRLLLDTGQRHPVFLAHGYVRAQGRSYDRDSERWGTTTADGISALGRTRTLATTWVRGREDDTKVYYTAGTLGIQLLERAMMAIDPVEWRIGISARDDLRQSFARAVHRVPLMHGILDDLPLTGAITGEADAHEPPVLLFDTSRPYSVLSLEYITANWTSHWRRWCARRACRRDRRMELAWRLPSGERVRVDTFIVERFDHGHGDALGVDAVHGVLGLDVLYRWLPLFDFAGRELVLFDFSAGL